MYLLQFFGADFESDSVDRNKKSAPSINKEIERNTSEIQAKNKDIEKENFNLENFNKLFDAEFDSQTNVEVSVDTTELSLPLVTNANKEEVFRFYWWDAYEDLYKQPGVVYMFGKVFVPSLKEHCSCCLTIKNIPRRIYLLPRVYVRIFVYRF